MKSIFKITSLLFIAIVFSNCEKSETKDNIVFEEISKEIIALGTDSIEGTCKYLVFELTK